jgi:peptidoglycan/LPS O-acetylase OafA/YrhL
MKDKIPYSWGIFVLCVIYCFLIGLFPQQGGVNYPLMNLLLPLPMIYITAFLGVTDIWVPKFLRSGDYSYGIYLYGWPLQQVSVAVLPENTSLFVHFLLVIPFITLFAAFSWHFIERPILKIRKKFSFVARVRLDANAG